MSSSLISPALGQLERLSAGERARLGGEITRFAPLLEPLDLRRCAVIIDLGAAPCRDESRDRASTNRSPESFINGLVFTLKGFTLTR